MDPMQHNVLNSVGTFNRCKLTRLVVDSDWDAKVWKENWSKQGQEEVLAEEEPPTTVEENPSKKRSIEPSDMHPARKKRKALELNDISWGEEVRPVWEEVLAFLKSATDSKTPSTAKQTTIVTLQGGDLVVAELVNIRGVVEAGESNARYRMLELEIAGAMAAMREEEVWSGQVTK